MLTAVPPGSNKVVRAGHQRHLKKETAEDLMMFRSFLLESAHQYMKTVPFLVQKKVFDEQLQLSADSAGNFLLGFSCMFGDCWAQGLWQEMSIFNYAKKPNIALLELFAIVMAVELWVADLSGKSIILHSNNSAMVAWINRKKSPIPAAMNLIRYLTKTCLHFQVVVLARHLPGHFNDKSDLISHRREHLILQKYPEMKEKPEPLPSMLWPPKVDRTGNAKKSKRTVII